MTFLSEILPDKFIFAAGWAIIDSIWQGAVIGIMLAAILLLVKNKPPRIKELLSFGALTIIFTLTVLNFSDKFSAAEKQNFENINPQLIKTDNNVAAGEFSSAEQTSEGITPLVNSAKEYFNQNVKYIVLFWLLGVFFFMIKLLGGFIYTQRIKFYKTMPAAVNITKMAARIKEQLEIDKKIEILESAIVKVPMVIGYFKPVVLFPVGLLTGMPPSQIEAILMHELAHIKRADYLINIFQSFVEVILFYHPVVWWISAVVRNERENDCDDAALYLNENKLVLANALLKVSEFNSGNSGIAMTSVGDKKQLLRRIKRMVNGNNESGISRRLSAVMLLLVMFLSLTAIACSSSEDVADDYWGNEWHSKRGHSDFSDITSNGFSFDEDGDYYRVRFRDGEIYKLYVNGSRVPENEIYKYEDMIYDKKDEVEDALEEVEEELSNINIDMDEVREEISKLKEFDSRELKKYLDEIKIELKDVHKDIIKDVRENDIISENIKVRIKDHLAGLEDIKVNIDMGDFHESMAELKENLAEINEEFAAIDWDEFKFDMKLMKEELKDFDVDMSEMKKELKKLKYFLRDFKDELVDDGYIDDYDDDTRIIFNRDELIINGREITGSDFEKYKRMFKEHFGKEIDEGFKLSE